MLKMLKQKKLKKKIVREMEVLHGIAPNMNPNYSIHLYRPVNLFYRKC